MSKRRFEALDGSGTTETSRVSRFRAGLGRLAAFLGWGIVGGYLIGYTLIVSSASATMFGGRHSTESAVGLILFAVAACLHPVALYFVSMYAVPAGLAMGGVACVVLRDFEPTLASLRLIGVSVVGTALVVLVHHFVDPEELPPLLIIYCVPLVAMALVRRRLRSQRPASEVR